jgi:hypothetical protein
MNMSLRSHLEELTAKHQSLETQISEAMQHPSVDTVELTRLKRRKLQLKDEMQRIEKRLSSH